MVTLECPWCEEAAPVPFPLPDEPEASFSCAECGTTVAWADEPVALDLAA
jgi:endogenous inhibitor of DNA gyrase (YacG/DUF329 family)